VISWFLKHLLFKFNLYRYAEELLAELKLVRTIIGHLIRKEGTLAGAVQVESS
jgi:hypothetical protein